MGEESADHREIIQRRYVTAHLQEEPDFLFNGCLCLWTLFSHISVGHDTKLEGNMDNSSYNWFHVLIFIRFEAVSLVVVFFRLS